MVDFAQWRSEDGNVTMICGALVALIGLIVIGVLHSRNVKGSILFGIAAATIAGIPLGVTKLSAFDMNIGAKFSDFAEVSFLNMDFRRHVSQGKKSLLGYMSYSGNAGGKLFSCKHV